MWLKEAFERPRCPLLMGRSSDLATVKSIDEVELENSLRDNLSKYVAPFSWRNNFTGKMQ